MDGESSQPSFFEGICSFWVGGVPLFTFLCLKQRKQDMFAALVSFDDGLMNSDYSLAYHV